MSAADDEATDTAIDEERDMQWYWRLENAGGREVHQKGLAVETFGTQSDAESWLGENWRELRESGVEQVTLIDDGVTIYGPMSLAEE